MTFRVVRTLSPFNRGVLVAFMAIGLFALGALAQDASARKSVKHKCIKTSVHAAQVTDELNELAEKGWRIRTTSIVSSGMKFKALVCLTR